MGGCITANRLEGSLQTVPIINISNETQDGLINLIDSDGIVYAHTFAGLTISLGILCLFFAVPIILRISKFNVDSVNRRIIILLMVSY